MCMIVGVEEMDVRRGRSELAGKGAGPVAEPTHRRACRRSVPERPSLGTSPCRSSSRSSVGRLAQADTPGHGRGVRRLRDEERRRQVGRSAAGAQAAARLVARGRSAEVAPPDAHHPRPLKRRKQEEWGKESRAHRIASRSMGKDSSLAREWVGREETTRQAPLAPKGSVAREERAEGG
jgi:hypothetical protein